MTDAPVPTLVVAAPGQSVAAQVAVKTAEAINNATPADAPVVKPADVVDRKFVEEIGVKTTGWFHVGDTWWREHSTWVMGAVVAVDSAVGIILPMIPARYPKLTLAFNMLGLATAKILTWRAQASVAVARVKAEVKRHTGDTA